MSYTYDYPRPNVTVDIVLFADTNPEERHFVDRTSVLLIKRRDDPFKGHWALPGGFVNEQEPLEVAAAREMEEEAKVKNLALRQVCAVGTPNRDPRGHTISIVFTAHEKRVPEVQAGDDADEAKWVRLDDLVGIGARVGASGHQLAFDHHALIISAFNLWVQ